MGRRGFHGRDWGADTVGFTPSGAPRRDDLPISLEGFQPINLSSHISQGQLRDGLTGFAGGLDVATQWAGEGRTAYAPQVLA